MKKLFLLLLLINTKRINAQTYVLIPDANFASYLQGLIPAAMSGNSLNTSSPLVTTSTHTINVNNQNISDLTGVQYFTSLTYLYCYQNSLTSLPALPNTLQLLYCFSNYLTSLPTLPGSLQLLYCFSNPLTSLPFLPNSITDLECEFNMLTVLPTLPNSLQVLYCHHNSLTNLPTLPNSIDFLDCSNNSLTSLPALPSSLLYLYCDHNSLTSLPNLPLLQNLLCGYNNIACFPIFPNTINNFNNLYFSIDPNPYNCLPNYIVGMSAADLATPLCAAGNSNGCPISSVGIKEFNPISKLNVYPNPTSGNFTIETNNIEYQTMSLYDLNGKLIFSQELKGQTKIDASKLSEGVYNLSIKTGNNIVNQKLVIVK